MSQAKLPMQVTIAICVLILASLVLSLNLTPTGDITWRFHIASSTLAGKEIYRDLIEVNPPLWFWASLGWAQIAKSLNVSGYVVMSVGVHIIGGLAVFLLNHLVSKTLNKWERGTFLVGFIIAYLYICIGEIGQREQALLVGTTLWIALAAIRLENKSVSPWIVITVALFGAYGFALKHYFVVIPIVIEICILVMLKRGYRPFRLETLILGAAAIAYAVAVFSFTPLFFERIVPLVLVAYDSFGSMSGVPLKSQLLQALAHVGFVLIPVIAMIFAKQQSKLTPGLFVFMILAAIILYLQFKGWRYHKLAAQGAAFLIVSLALGSALARDQLRDKREIRTAFACVIGGLYLFVISPTIILVRDQGQSVSSSLRQLVLSEPQSSRIAILSIAPEHAFYLLHQANRPKWSRHYSLWMLPGLQTPKTDPKGEANRVVEFNRVRREFVADLTCIPPDVIVSEKGTMTVKDKIEINTIEYVKQDARFSAWFEASYKQAEQFEVFTVWRLKGAKPPPGACPRDP